MIFSMMMMILPIQEFQWIGRGGGGEGGGWEGTDYSDPSHQAYKSLIPTWKLPALWLCFPPEPIAIHSWTDPKYWWGGGRREERWMMMRLILNNFTNSYTKMMGSKMNGISHGGGDEKSGLDSALLAAKSFITIFLIKKQIIRKILDLQNKKKLSTDNSKAQNSNQNPSQNRSPTKLEEGPIVNFRLICCQRPRGWHGTYQSDRGQKKTKVIWNRSDEWKKKDQRMNEWKIGFRLATKLLKRRIGTEKEIAWILFWGFGPFPIVMDNDEWKKRKGFGLDLGRRKDECGPITMVAPQIRSVTPYFMRAKGGGVDLAWKDYRSIHPIQQGWEWGDLAFTVVNDYCTIHAWW